MQARIEELIIQSFQSLILDEDERATGLRGMAVLVRKAFLKQVDTRADSLPIRPVEDIERELLQRSLEPETTFLPYDARAVLRTKFRLPPEPAPEPGKPAGGGAAPASTNAPAGTNALAR